MIGIVIFWSLLTDNTIYIRSTAADSISATATGGINSHECPMTPRMSSNGKELPFPGNYGNESLSTILGSRITFRPGGAGMVHTDGSLSMKFMWWRLRKGQLTIGGRRLDGPAPPLRAHIPAGYGDIGFQATGVIFPTPGCWEVTGRVGDGSLTFVVWVEKIGEGPCGKEDRAPNETGGTVATIAWTEERITESMYGIREFRVSGEREYEGGKTGIRGKSKFQLNLTRQPGTPATFVGYEQITATIGERKGSFTISHTGNIKNGIERSTWEILDSSGTGELAQIAGHGEYSSGLDDLACYRVIYSGV